MKRICALLTAILIMFTLLLPAFAETAGEWQPAVVDSAALLTSSDVENLEKKIDAIRSEYNYDVVIHTVDSAGDKSAQEYADDFYDYNGYGAVDGYDRDGMAFVLIMDTRKYYISTRGLGIDAFNDAAIAYIGDEIVADLKAGDYYAAFDGYLDLVSSYLYDYKNGVTSGTGDSPEDGENDILTRELLVVAVSILIAFIVVSVMKKKMNTAVKGERATEYMRPGSMKVNYRKDTFLYNTVSKVAKPKESDNSSTHTSSSGASHGGGGGNF